MEKTLVSVAVITYNSSKYVVETLESIKNQTYTNIELIVSDDCSTDNTVSICKNWIEKNKDRFVRTQLIDVKSNAGVSANCNRAEDACRAEWVKLIAGDDCLLPNCITDFMSYIMKNPETVYVFGKIEFIGGKPSNSLWPNYDIFKLNTSKQYDWLIEYGNCIPAPSSFYNVKKCREMQIRYDERIPNIEDRPRWLNVLKKNIHLDFMDKTVVAYRISHSDSLSSSLLYSSSFFKSQRLVFFYYYFPNKYKESEKCINEIVEYETHLYDNYTSIINSNAYKLGTFILKPLYFLKKFFNPINN